MNVTVTVDRHYKDGKWEIRLLAPEWFIADMLAAQKEDGLVHFLIGVPTVGWSMVGNDPVLHRARLRADVTFEEINPPDLFAEFRYRP